LATGVAGRVRQEVYLAGRRSAVPLLAVAAAGLAAGTLVSSKGATANGMAAASSVTRVAVTATDSRFTLSRQSAPVGTVIFTVTNRGKKQHDFKIAGKKTSLLAPGHSASLRVTFSKKGRYPYLSTVSGEAAAGLKGAFSVVASAQPVPTTTAPYVPPSGPVGTASTTVAVALWDAGSGEGWILLSQKTIPSGTVTFVITNHCMGGCTFDLVGVKAGAALKPGESETWTVALAPGVYRYHCDFDPTGMQGSFTVTA
jgi:plastocyanin